jgi:hypothetical protein
MDFVIENIPMIAEKKDASRDSYELHIEAEDREKRVCEVSRVKYVLS